MKVSQLLRSLHQKSLGILVLTILKLMCLKKTVHKIMELHSLQNNLPADSVAIHDRSPLLETEYRNKILDDLFEVKAFLNQWLIELRNENTTSLQHQVQAVAPLVLQQYSSDIIQTMLSDISSAISLLTNMKTRDMIMILKSKRFLDRLVNTMEEKNHQEAKLKDGLKELSCRHMELQNSMSSSWPKQVILFASNFV
ncbi:putative outer envelope pore protein 16-3, chloroplastic/mitochondrial-like isoform X1 [Capsicum annuum]|nr:putative outer envelope pore protein 16-3, chloroplastic/mitochondrial-like isoform X1 [Capsicum annuum]KAF3640062.1 putative outer envelope pore protein 16-3, chloroplastic/mitochondrial-like isoform X1 [Capsicum annuum]